jgi:hypothetical protein
MSPESYIRREGPLYQLGKDDHLAYVAGQGPAGTLSNYLAQILKGCDRFRTVAEHVKHLQEKGWEETDQGDLQSGLQELVQAGLLRSRKSFLDLVLGHTPSSPGTQDRHRVTSLAWTTCDRVDTLARSVESWKECALRYGWDLRAAVMDNSTDPRQRSACRDVCAAKSPLGGGEILYAGAEEREDFVRNLEASLRPDGIPEGLVRFALLDGPGVGMRYGAARNALLLAFPDEQFLCVDDDTLCRTASLVSHEKGLELCDAGDPTGIDFFADGSELDKRVEVRDVVASHEALLGRSVASCIRDVSSDTRGQVEALRLDRMGPAMVHLLEQGKGSVYATIAGIAGDSAMKRNWFVLAVDGTSRERLHADRSVYYAAVHGCRILKAAVRPTIAQGGFMVSLCLGMDNRRLLPPYFPAGRNEDGLFARTLRACHTDAFLAHLPFGVQHDRTQRWPYGKEDLSGFSLQLNDILGILVERLAADLRSNDPACRTDDLGRRLAAIGRMESTEFREYLALILLSYLEQYVAHLEGLRARHGGRPKEWDDDVAAHIRGVQSYMGSELFGVPEELFGPGEIRDAPERFPRMIRTFGELLCWWPRIREAARELNREGRGIIPLHA